jgi:CRP/FNR family transcriptional regulator, cyclic AMP receptor protein
VNGRVRPDVLERFRRVPLFGMLSSKTLRLIAGAAREEDLPAGTVLVREGDQGRDLFVIMRGEAVVTRGGALVTRLAVGDFFGEFALLADEPRSATITAGIDVRVMVLSAAAMQAALDREPQLFEQLQRSRERRLRMLERATAL